MNETLREDEDLYGLNVTIEQCKILFWNHSDALGVQHPEGFCRVTTDGVLCWPPTPVNGTATVKCFSELFNIKYDDTQNATRDCFWNGTWSKSDYSSCREIISISANVEAQTTIYFVGYTLSLITLTIAMAIFTYFKELRCLRNRIHMNLMWSYMLTYCMWILTLISLNFGSSTSLMCISMVTLLHYFHITTFFWMFVEGLYLYILVVETLTRENFKLTVYACIGWGLPMIFILIWAIVKSCISITDDPSNAGFTVALFYCFLNTEVQNAVRHHFETWKTRRSLGSRRFRASCRSKDWSPRSRTESIRLYSQPTNIYHKRESSASEITTTTLVTVNGGSKRPSNDNTNTRSPFLHPPRLFYGGSV